MYIYLIEHMYAVVMDLLILEMINMYPILNYDSCARIDEIEVVFLIFIYINLPDLLHIPTDTITIFYSFYLLVFLLNIWLIY